MLTSPYILVIALHSNIFILFFLQITLLEIQDCFETNYYFPFKINISLHLSVGDLLWAYPWFSNCSFRALQVQVFPVRAADPQKMKPCKNHTKNKEVQTPTVASTAQHIFPINPDVLRCIHLLIELSRCLSVPMMLLLWFPTSFSCEGLNHTTYLMNNWL